MAGQMRCEQCGATYDGSIFLPGQSFHCLECNAEMIVPASIAAPTPAPLPIEEPDTQIYQVPEALSRELPAAREPSDSGFAEEEVTVTGYDLDAESEAIANASLSLQADEPSLSSQGREPSAEGPASDADVIVRGRETIDRAAFESGEQPTVRAAGFERTLTAQQRPSSPGHPLVPASEGPHMAEPTNVASPGPDMLAILTPPHAPRDHRDTEEAPSFEALESAASSHEPGPASQEQAHSMDALDAASDDWDIPTRSNEQLPAVGMGADIYEEDTVSPAEAAKELQAAKESASKHTLHEEIAAPSRTISAQSFHELEGVEEILTPLSPQERQPGPDSASQPSPDASGYWGEQTDAPLSAAPSHSHRASASAQISTGLPAHEELAQIVEEAGGAMAPTIESSEAMGRDESNEDDFAATQLEFPVPEGGFQDPNAPKSNGVHRSNGSHGTGAGPVSLAADDDEPVLVPGGFWRRSAAWIVDLIMVYGLTGVGLWWVLRLWPPRTWLQGAIFLRLPPPFMQFLAVFVASVACLFVVLLVNVLYFGIGYKYKGASLGKGLLGLQVRHAHTRKYIGFKQTFLREVIGKFLSVFLLLSGLLMVAFRKDKQSLHDLVFTTQVVRRPDE